MIMWKVISVIVLTALGIIGAKKLQSSNRKGIHIPSPNEDRYSSSRNPSTSRPLQVKHSFDEFDLSRLQALFDAYSIQISAYDALYHLLNAIEKKSYIGTIRAISEKANTPTDLIELSASPLPEGPFNQIVINQGTGGPYIKKEYIINLCRDKGVAVIGSVDDMIKNLIVANAKSGMRHFNTVFGHRIQSMKEKMEAGEDVTSDFAALKAKFAEKI